MDGNSGDLINNKGGDGEGRKEGSSSSSVPPDCANDYRLFDRKLSVHQLFGGGKAADVLLWKRWHASFGVIIVATVVFILWLLSVLGSYCSFFTLAYVGITFSITVPALYNRYEDLVDR